jgi:hypothetical protein
LKERTSLDGSIAELIILKFIIEKWIINVWVALVASVFVNVGMNL